MKIIYTLKAHCFLNEGLQLWFWRIQKVHWLWHCSVISRSNLIYSWIELYLYTQAKEDGRENKIEEETREEVAAVERNMSLRSRTTILSTKTMTSSIEMGENSIEEEGDLADEENEQVFSVVDEQKNKRDNIVLNWLEIRHLNDKQRTSTLSPVNLGCKKEPV